jgi:hypothetical protein
MTMGTASYIAQSLVVPTAEYYVALDEIRPPVPEAGLRPAADLVNHLGDDDLLQLAVRYAHTTVARFALDALGRRRIGISALANRLASFCKRSSGGSQKDDDGLVEGQFGHWHM